MPDSALPRHLQLFHPKTGELIGSLPHWDYPKWLSWVPRGWTAFKWGAPKQILGNQKHKKLDEKSGELVPMPVPNPGEWQISRFPNGPWFAFYFAAKLKNGWHFRLGARWDDNDNYVQFPTFALRHLPPERTDTTT